MDMRHPIHQVRCPDVGEDRAIVAPRILQRHSPLVFDLTLDGMVSTVDGLLKTRCERPIPSAQQTVDPKVSPNALTRRDGRA